MVKTKKLKIVSILFLAFALIITEFSFDNMTNAASSQSLTIYSDNEEVKDILLDENKSQTLTAVGLSKSAKYQWQILMPHTTNTWINIYDMDRDECKLTYALLKSLLDSNGQTVIRCIANLDDKQYTSQSVYVTINYYISETTPNDTTNNLENDTSYAKKNVSQSLFSLTSDETDIENSDTNESEYITIKIHYKMEQEGEEVERFSSYIATLHRGSSFSATVPSPIYVGYTPTLNKDGDVYEDATNVYLNYTDLQSDKEITVWYRPTYVKYTARYFLQNVLNDSYTEDTRLKIEGKALTGDYPSEEIDIEIEGFTALFHEPDTVAADGSTEFNCYYDRNFYLYNIDCHGGYGVDPVYARYGTTLLINQPTRTGYIFKGWDKMDENGEYDGVADTISPTIGIGNETYRAIWEATNCTFNVVYWLENADDSAYSFITSHEYSTISGMNLRLQDLDNFKLTSKEGDIYDENGVEIPYYVDADYIVYDKDKTATSNKFNDIALDGSPCISVDGDGSTIVNIVFTRKEYTLKFFYAKSQVEDDVTKYYVVGGSTYHFGWANTNDEQTMLEAENNQTSEWGEVTALPSLNENGKAKNYTLGSETYNNVTYYYLSFKAKYGADISDLWPVSIFNSVTRTKANTHGKWSGMEAYRSAWNGEPYVKYTQDNLPNGNQTIKGVYQKLDSTILYDLSRFDDSSTVRYLCFWENGADISWSIPKQFIYEYYVPVLDDEKEDITYNGVKYKLYIGPFNTYDDSNAENQTASALDGFTYLTRNSKKNSDVEDDNGNKMESYTVQFFYTRNKYTLEFHNYNSESSTTCENVPYGTSLKSYFDAMGTPNYPSGLEEGAYKFDGWYLAPNGQGDKINLQTSATMPSDNLTIYAYWKPVENKVTFSNTYSDMLNDTYIDITSVSHGDYLDPKVIPTPSSISLGEGTYHFQGWFYIDNTTGEKKAFDTSGMPITENIKLFAEWQSSSIVKYTIHYQFRDVYGETRTIASNTTGYAYAGMTKTFTAKAETELFEGYQAHYYPTVNSHSILMDKSSDANEYTFEYVYKANVSYTVRYVDKTTGTQLAEDKFMNTENTVITEKFKVIDGYVPDAYYKRLVLSVDDSQNMITFYYTKDNEHAIYVVRHMIEELDGSYTEYASIEGVGNIDTKLPIQTPLNIIGFSYDVNITKRENSSNVTVSDNGVSGTLDKDGLEMCIYYKRNDYQYTVKYLEYGTGNEIKTSLEGTGKYGSTLIINNEGQEMIPKYIDDDGVKYDLIGDTSRNIVIRDDTNEIIIYYQAEVKNINYIAVSIYPGATDFGTVSLASETVKSATYMTGSIATAKEGYYFAGWYTDAACTTPVDEKFINDNHITPSMPVEDTVYYYALFKPITNDLTITKSGVNDTDFNQNFLFRIKGKEGATASIDIIVSITGNGHQTIKDLPVGEYTITELTDWSWRYTIASSSQVVKIVNNNTTSQVTFNNSPNHKTWLGGETSKENKYTFQ